MVRGRVSISCSRLHHRCSPNARASRASRPPGSGGAAVAPGDVHPFVLVEAQSGEGEPHGLGPHARTDLGVADPGLLPELARTASWVSSPRSMPPPGISHQSRRSRPNGSRALINRTRSAGSSTTTRAARRRDPAPSIGGQHTALARADPVDRRHGSPGRCVPWGVGLAQRSHPRRRSTRSPGHRGS